MAESDHVATPNAATRRTLLRGALVAGVATPFLAACGSGDTGASNSPPSSSPEPKSSDSPGAGSGSGGGGSSDALAQVADVPKGSGLIVTDPAPGVIITQPAAGTFNGFNNVCKHMGCPLANVTETINCGCHGSQYSIKDGSPVTGPNGSPPSTITALDPKAVTVKDGSVFLA